MIGLVASRLISNFHLLRKRHLHIPGDFLRAGAESKRGGTRFPMSHPMFSEMRLRSV